MADILLQFLCREGNAPASALWINDPEEGLEPLTGYALDNDHFNASREDMNDGPVGQAVRLAKPVVMDVPGRYLLISSASGDAARRCVSSWCFDADFRAAWCCPDKALAQQSEFVLDHCPEGVRSIVVCPPQHAQRVAKLIMPRG